MEDGYTIYAEHKLYPKQEIVLDWSAIIPFWIITGILVGLMVFALMQNPQFFTWLLG